MGKQRRSYTPEFKQEAVDLCRRSGKSECQVELSAKMHSAGSEKWVGWKRIACILHGGLPCMASYPPGPTFVR